MTSEIPPKVTFADWNALIAGYQNKNKEVLEALTSMSDQDMDILQEDLFGRKMTRAEGLVGVLHDMIHHRGQMTVYLRMADGKVPSIYGPTADTVQ